MEEVYIIDAARTAIGSCLGALKNLAGHQLGTILIKQILSRSNLIATDIDEVIMGEVLTGGHGQNTARQAAINAGIPNAVPALTINQVCGSGLRSVAMAMNLIGGGNYNVVLAGGQESMSQARHAAYLRQGLKMGNIQSVDMIMSDGLTDIFNNYHMGVTAENLVAKYNISRLEQDEFAFNSHQKAKIARESGKFDDEIVPVEIRIKNDVSIFVQDETIRADTTLDKLGKLNPAFVKDGTVTAGNSSSVNDGAALLLLASKTYAKKHGLKPMARIVAYAVSGVDPAIMGIGPVTAVSKAMAYAGWNLKDLDAIEANEAFAAQAIAVNREIGWDTEKVNISGGAIALGHPIGASGARILVTLIHQLKNKKGHKGIATLCVGGGMGIAMCVEVI